MEPMTYGDTYHGDPSRVHIDPTAGMCNTFFNTGGGEIWIGAYTFFGQHVSLITGGHDCTLRGKARMETELKGKDIRIGCGVFVGSHAIILGGVTIGDNAVIGAGSVVISNVPAEMVVFGNPARIVMHCDMMEKSKP